MIKFVIVPFILVLSEIYMGLRERLYWITYNFDEGDYRSIISNEIYNMWKSEELPYRYGKGWIAGFKVSGTFLTCELIPIKVGPKKPSKYKATFSRSYYRKGYVYGTYVYDSQYSIGLDEVEMK